MNTTPPWSRVLATQPVRTTGVPACSARRSPHMCVRPPGSFPRSPIAVLMLPSFGSQLGPVSLVLRVDPFDSPGQHDVGNPHAIRQPLHRHGAFPLLAFAHQDDVLDPCP